MSGDAQTYCPTCGWAGRCSSSRCRKIAAMSPVVAAAVAFMETRGTQERNDLGRAVAEYRKGGTT